MNQKRNFRPLVLAAAVLATIATIFYFISQFISKNLGNIGIHQILLNIKMAEASNELVLDYVKTAIPFVLKAVLTICLIWYLSSVVNKYESLTDWIDATFNKIRLLIKKLPSSIDKKPQTVALVLLLSLTLYCMKSIDKRQHVSEFFLQENSNFIEENYAKLDVGSGVFKDGKKKNLILVFAESIEKGYANPNVYGENLIPELADLKREGVSLYGYKKTPGAYFTLDGISAQTLGMPLTQVPFDIHNAKFDEKYGALLSQSPGIFNLLKASGYKTASFSGTSKNFSNKGKFLNVHGVDHTFFKEHWLDAGFELNDDTRGMWDFNDIFLMERFKEYLSKAKTDEPFAVIFETVDTHFPNGWAPESYRRNGGYKDAVRFSSKLIRDFVEWSKTQPWYENTVIVIVGDHPFQDFNVDFTKYTKQSNDREIYTLLMNSNIKQDIVSDCGFAPMDIAPTILHAMGISFTSSINGVKTSNKIGLGTSLLSNEKNLVCQYGEVQLSKKLLDFSRFYQELH